MFKFKDLYVALTAETPSAGENVGYYDAPLAPLTIDSIPPCMPYGPVGTTACCEGYSLVAVFPSPKAVQLKEHLAGQLQTHEMKKVAIQQSDHLGTVAEIEALEEKLNGALSELKNRKAQLKAKGASAK